MPKISFKNLSGVVVSGLLLSSSLTWAAAEDVSPDLLKQYLWGNFDFNGKAVAKKNPNDPVNYKNDEKWATEKMGDVSYRLDWGTEKVGSNGDEITTLTESKISSSGKDKDPGIIARTTTFNGNRVRSSTECYGFSAGNQKDLKCVTATRKACDRLKLAYDIEANSKDATTGKNSEVVRGDVAATKAKVEQCQSLLGSMSKLATAFAKESSQLGSRRDQVIDSDMDRVKAHVDKAMNRKFWNSTNLASQSKAGDVDATVSTFTNSVTGLRAVQAAMDICDKAKGKFDETAGNSSLKDMEFPTLPKVQPATTQQKGTN